MHSFEVHSNESVCRKKVRLGLEQFTGSGGDQAPCLFTKRTPRGTNAQKMTVIGAAHREGGGTHRRGGTRSRRTPSILQGPGSRPRAATRGANDAGYDGRRMHAAQGS